MSRWKRLNHVLIGAAIAIVVVVPLGAFAFVKSGIYNVGASSPHTKFTTWLTHETMIHSVRRNAADVAPPSSAGRDQIVAGFCAYETHCVACHGASGVARQRWAAGMEPAPPYLLDSTRKFTAPQLFWTVKNGIKMTGMPSWREAMRDEEIWNVVAFLQAMPRMNADAYRKWRSAGVCAPDREAVRLDRRNG